MKKFLTITLSIILLFAMPLIASVSAVSGTYDIDELGIHLTIPSGYYVLTRDTPAGDPIFSDLGVTRSAVIQQFEAGSIYLDAISDTYLEEIVVTMTNNDLNNFTLLGDTALTALASTLADQYAIYGYNVSQYEIYHHSQAKFIRLYFTDTDKTVHGLQYYTIYDGKAMNFTMRSYEGSLSSRQEAVIKTIVDSIKYDNASPVIDSGENTSRFIYTDADSGVIFTVPANWKQEALTKERETIDVKFVTTKGDDCVMLYGSMDMWGQMSTSERAGMNRSDLNNSSFAKSDLAEMLDTTASNISTVTYNGAQYFKIENSYSTSAYGISLSVPMTMLVRIENGWMYLFQFSGTSTHSLYSDFESLLKSVHFPATQNVSGGGSANNTSSNSTNSTGVIVVIILLVSAAIIGVVFFVVRKKKIKATSAHNFPPIHNSPVPESPSNIGPVIYCIYCGQALPLDSTFCHKCGKKIEKEI